MTDKTPDPLEILRAFVERGRAAQAEIDALLEVERAKTPAPTTAGDCEQIVNGDPQNPSKRVELGRLARVPRRG